ncbi:hypothetical protein [Bradyrhizobium sp. BR 10289]|uniref:hypothetical protein n=1 Tax=Bradyrhizobium sp. BR 10289 TaxID=2749993 RepID=UPI001C64CD40|nr:hypothetical protein [Bradyrhizobium sp. BR 10289]MBW7970993.1 hypothetical protein [Bradyrhizobium sp. BR 10289]
MIKNVERLAHVAHSKSFHATHGVAHVAYFVTVFAEGHGLYAVIGGVMVVFSLINVIVDDVERT